MAPPDRRTATSHFAWPTVGLWPTPLLKRARDVIPKAGASAGRPVRTGRPCEVCAEDGVLGGMRLTRYLLAPRGPVRRPGVLAVDQRALDDGDLRALVPVFTDGRRDKIKGHFLFEVALDDPCNQAAS